MANRIYQFRMGELAQYQFKTLIFYLFTSIVCSMHEACHYDYGLGRKPSRITCLHLMQTSAIWNTWKTILRLHVKYDFGMRMMHIVRMEIILRLIISLTAQAHLVMLSLLHSTHWVTTGNGYVFPPFTFICIICHLRWCLWCVTLAICTFYKRAVCSHFWWMCGLHNFTTPFFHKQNEKFAVEFWFYTHTHTQNIQHVL